MGCRHGRGQRGSYSWGTHSGAAIRRMTLHHCLKFKLCAVGNNCFKTIEQAELDKVSALNLSLDTSKFEYSKCFLVVLYLFTVD